MPEPTTTPFWQKMAEWIIAAIGGGFFFSLFGWRKGRDVAKIKKDGAVEVRELEGYDKMLAYMQKRVSEVESQILVVVKEKNEAVDRANAERKKAMEAELAMREIKLDMDRLIAKYEKDRMSVCFRVGCKDRVLERV